MLVCLFVCLSIRWTFRLTIRRSVSRIFYCFWFVRCSTDAKVIYIHTNIHMYVHTYNFVCKTNNKVCSCVCVVVCWWGLWQAVRLPDPTLVLFCLKFSRRHCYCWRCVRFAFPVVAVVVAAAVVGVVILLLLHFISIFIYI